MSYLFYSRVELKKADRSITEFVECSEYCRRRILLSAVGSPEEKQPARILFLSVVTESVIICVKRQDVFKV